MKNFAQLSDLTSRVTQFITSRFSLRGDKADDTVIDEGIRAGVVMRGTNLWVLMLAILIASVGLNVNSPAVIIGAMLISPLMGPIIGIGYSVGINDFDLLKRSLLNIAIATVISFITSTIYFLLSPLAVIDSELLARTAPSIWDVLIAVCGGLAGIIALTRKEKSNVIPGVAIATALMPPLCTAGFGLASGNWDFLLGAFYLFIINCVFIAFASFIVVWYLKLPQKNIVDHQLAMRFHRWIIAVVLVTMIPSVYLAYQMVNRAIFNAKASQFIVHEFHFEHTNVVDTEIDFKLKTIEVTLIGELIDQEVINGIQNKLPIVGLKQATLVVHQAVNNIKDLNRLKEGVINDLYRGDLRALRERSLEMQKFQQELTDSAAWKSLSLDIEHELNAQYPDLTDIIVGEGVTVSKEGGDMRVPLLTARSHTRQTRDAYPRIERWFQARTKSKTVRVIIVPVPVQTTISTKKM